MNLSTLTKIVHPRKKRVGRGIGSGKGKTAGRGYKGAKARGKIPAGFIGGTLALYKKLPYRRGWTRNGGNPTRSLKPVLIRLKDLNNLEAKSVVNVESLIKNKLVSANEVKKRGVKILASGELKKALIFELPISGKVKQMVERVGGSVV